MEKPKHINPPKFEKARRLSMLELNGMKPDDKHTVITPEMLSKTN